MAHLKPLSERIKLFREDPINRKEMARILDNEVMVNAMALLREMYLPGPSVILPTADNTTLTIALKNATQAGAHDYAAELFRLCDEPEKADEDQSVAGGLLKEGEKPPFDPRTQRGRAL